MYLCELMYPSLEKSLRKELTERAERFIVQKCGSRLSEVLNQAPAKPREQSCRARVCGVSLEPQSHRLALVFVN